MTVLELIEQPTQWTVGPLADRPSYELTSPRVV